jgi:Putative sugar-binding domain
MNRVIGIELGSLKRASRVVALRGGWINVLITDRHTAEKLLAVAEEKESAMEDSSHKRRRPGRKLYDTGER